jgi:hypothetical protein
VPAWEIFSCLSRRACRDGRLLHSLSLDVATTLVAVAVPMTAIVFVVSNCTTWLVLVVFLASLMLGGVTLRIAN